MTRRSDHNGRASFWRVVLLGYVVALLATIVTCAGGGS